MAPRFNTVCTLLIFIVALLSLNNCNYSHASTLINYKALIKKLFRHVDLDHNLLVDKDEFQASELQTLLTEKGVPQQGRAEA